MKKARRRERHKNGEIWKDDRRKRETRMDLENRLCSNMYSTLSLAACNDITKRDAHPNFETNMNSSALPLPPSRLI